MFRGALSAAAEAAEGIPPLLVAAAERGGINLNNSKDFRTEHGSINGQKLALTFKRNYLILPRLYFFFSIDPPGLWPVHNWDCYAGRFSTNESLARDRV